MGSFTLMGWKKRGFYKRGCLNEYITTRMLLKGFGQNGDIQKGFFVKLSCMKKGNLVNWKCTNGVCTNGKLCSWRYSIKLPLGSVFYETHGALKIASDNQPSPPIPSSLTKPPPPFSQLQPLTTSVQSSPHSALH